jgi:hypothetical protein
MHERRVWGRPLYSTNYVQPPDPVPVCLMHSADPNKDEAQFQQEIASIVYSATSDSIADFTRFVFPTSQYVIRGFSLCPSKCSFVGAVFSKEANFFATSFTHGADFQSVAFQDKAMFGGCKFGAMTNFENAVFKDEAAFFNAEFREVSFRKAHFTREANFHTASFAELANFGDVRFEGKAMFGNAKFHGWTNFSDSDFSQDAFFYLALFNGGSTSQPASHLKRISRARSLKMRILKKPSSVPPSSLVRRSSDRTPNLSPAANFLTRSSCCLNPRFSTKLI